MKLKLFPNALSAQGSTIKFALEFISFFIYVKSSFIFLEIIVYNSLNSIKFFLEMSIQRARDHL